MYNGIGLKTARGTGTNGYIQRNISHFQPRQTPFDKQQGSSSFREPVRHTQPDAGILEHERKRKIELQCMELQVQLEDQDASEDIIEAKVAELRATLTQKLASSSSPLTALDGGRIGPGETHKLRAAKNAEDSRMGSALNVDRNYREGDAFDRELQQQRKEERLENRRLADEQRKADWQRKKQFEMERQQRLSRPIVRKSDDIHTDSNIRRSRFPLDDGKSRRSVSRNSRSRSSSVHRRAGRSSSSRSDSPPVRKHRRSPSFTPPVHRQRRSPSASTLSPSGSDSESEPGQVRQSSRRSPRPSVSSSESRTPSPSPSPQPAPVSVSARRSHRHRDAFSPLPSTAPPPPGPPPTRPPGL